MSKKTSIHFTISQSNYEYIKMLKEERDYNSLSITIDNLITEHKDKIHLKQNDTINLISDQIHLSAKKYLEDELKKIRITSNKIDFDLKTIIEVINGILILNDIGGGEELAVTNELESKVLIKAKSSQSKQFESYIDYMDREEAKIDKGYNHYSLYNEYMSNEMKSSGLFSDAKSNLSEDEKKKMKDLFNTAQKNKSALWQDVFSFNNEKLEEQGFYNSKTKELDEEAIREATCNTMNYLLEEDNLKESAIWTASIHYNTKHIHVHIAICGPFPSRSRGKRKQKTLDKMKSVFANTLLDYNKNYTKINEVIRDNIIENKKDIRELNNTLSKDIHLKHLYKRAIENLPKDKKQWAYNYNTMKESRVYLDKITEHYLKNDKIT